MKKCKCSFEIQTRAANLHIPSSDKNQKVSINARCDRGKIEDVRANAQDWNTGLICRKGLWKSRADISGSGRRFCLFEFNFEDVSHCAMWARLKPLHIPLNAPWKLSYMIISPYVFIWQNLFYCTKKSPHLWGFCLIEYLMQFLHSVTFYLGSMLDTKPISRRLSSLLQSLLMHDESHL